MNEIGRAILDAKYGKQVKNSEFLMMITRRRDRITLDEAKKDLNLRDAYSKQIVSEVLAMGEFATIKPHIKETGYRDELPGHDYLAFTTEKGDVFITRSGIAVAENEVDVAGYVVHELEHLAHRKGLRKDMPSHAEEEVLAYKKALEFLMRQGGSYTALKDAVFGLDLAEGGIAEIKWH